MLNCPRWFSAARVKVEFLSTASATREKNASICIGFPQVRYWSIPEIVDTSETRENAQRGVPCRSCAAIPNHPKKKPHRRNDEVLMGDACID
jgi:hypothetical protein